MARGWTIAIVLAGGLTPLMAQTAASVSGAATIVPIDLKRHVEVIAHDSMRGRPTPSRELKLTADYVAKQFASARLKRIAENGTSWFTYYPLPPRLDFARSQLTFAAGGVNATTDLSSAVRLAGYVVPDKPVGAGVVLVAGLPTREVIATLQRWQKVVLYVPPVGLRKQDLDRQLDLELLAGGTRGVVVLSNQDSATFAQHLRDGRVETMGARMLRSQNTMSWALQVRPEAVGKLGEVFAAAGLDLARIRADTTTLIRDLPEMKITFAPQFEPVPGDTMPAPIVMGKLEGHDPRYAYDYVVFIAHLDHTSTPKKQSDTDVNGVDDNAVGIAGLIALAKAFSQAAERPRRPILFVAVSGRARGLWGSQLVAQAYRPRTRYATSAPRERAVAAVNIDMIGRRTGDTLSITGLEEVAWSTAPAWIAAAHPELQLTLADGGTLFQPTSDHFPLARAWIPSLSFQNGRHDDQSMTNNVVSQLDLDQAARIIRFAYYVGLDAANADKSPSWTETGRRLLLDRVP